jgi:hypothetical protein
MKTSMIIHNYNSLAFIWRGQQQSNNVPQPPGFIESFLNMDRNAITRMHGPTFTLGQFLSLRAPTKVVYERALNRWATSDAPRNALVYQCF